MGVLRWINRWKGCFIFFLLNFCPGEEVEEED